MNHIKEKHVKTIKNLLESSKEEIKNLIPTWSKGVYTNKKRSAFLFDPKNESKVCLVAHIDTVGYDETKRNTIYDAERNEFRLADEEKGKKPLGQPDMMDIDWESMTAEAINEYFDKFPYTKYRFNCLGGDDRAGMFACMYILNYFMTMKQPFNESDVPFVLFCDEEETGGAGASDACVDFPQLMTVDYFIEIDRRENMQCTFPSKTSKEWEMLVTGFGFTKHSAVFTDVMILGRQFDKLSVNLSAGYLCPHSENETLKLDFLDNTITAAVKLIERINEYNTVDALDFTYNDWLTKDYPTTKNYGNKGSYVGDYFVDHFDGRVNNKKKNKMNKHVSYNDTKEALYQRYSHRYTSGK